MVLEGLDFEIIHACRRGEADAFRVLFEAYQDKVYSIALRYSGDRTTALDIAQDVFLKLLSSMQDFRGEAGFESWLYRLVVNRCLDYHRRSRRIRVMVEDALSAFTAPRETALHDLLRSEVEEQVQRSIDRLAPEQRIVVVLRYTEGMSYDQIAEILGCSMGTVASRLNRAHKALEKRLAPLRRMYE
ncbi:MAG: sigma-70 family RNA polymerase sigma factor [Acidobacteriia bacterium]|nr:sigma-70 family RNA polymerase sigma factor [Terriglobia bacterium]